MRFEIGTRWRLTMSGRSIEVSKCGRTRVSAFYIDATGNRCQPEFKNVVSFSIDFLEQFTERLTTTVDERTIASLMTQQTEAL